MSMGLWTAVLVLSVLPSREGVLWQIHWQKYREGISMKKDGNKHKVDVLCLNILPNKKPSPKICYILMTHSIPLYLKCI